MRINTLATIVILFACPVSFAAAQFQDGENSSGYTQYRPEADLFQVSTLGALVDGVFEGAYPIGLLRRQGNFGVGTYDGIDGEMVVLDGHFYHARSDGSVVESKNEELASFAAVVDFEPARRYPVAGMTMAQLNTYIAALIPSDNYFYAIKIHGLFSSVKARAIPKQTPPYPTLAQATQQEVIFPKENVQGTAVVIRSPQYVSNLNVAGDHYHFISDDHQYGGHALDLTLASGTLEIEEVRRNTLWLPTTGAFQQAPLPAPAK